MNHEAVGFSDRQLSHEHRGRLFCSSIREAGARIDYFHIADNTRTYPGSGHIPFGEIIAALKEVGYAGYLSAQLAQKPDFETAASRTMEYLKARL